MKKFLPAFFLLSQFLNPVFAQYPTKVEAILLKSGKNSFELKKAIDYFKKGNDSLKVKAIYFLVENMDIHYSADYYWSDSANKKIAFSELDYPDFATSVSAFEQLKKKYGKVKPVPVIYRDIETIKADFLIDNVERAFEVWNKEGVTSEQFQNFCEYILPYRASIEPLQKWRQVYREKFSTNFLEVNEASEEKKLWQFTTGLENTTFTNSFSFENRKEPLPRLGALQLLHRKKGPCEDIADFKVFALRSQGVAASVDAVPYWATSSGGHFLVNAFTSELKPVSLEVLKDDVPAEQKLAREPSKVLRTTFSKQIGALASFTDTAAIPEGFLRMQNYKDVTSEYWKTQDIQFQATGTEKLVYACVFNHSKWKPAWWGIVKGDTVTFTDMPQGAVFLPAFYKNGKIQPAGYPIAAVNNTQKELKPDLERMRSVSLPWQENYLVYRVGSRYKLYYWDNMWKLLQEQTATNTDKLVFHEVPSSALLLLRPDYSSGKERPFIITEEGQRIWW